MANRLTSKKINEIKNLRSHGYSLPEIAKVLKIGKGTAWRYIKNVVISKKYEKILLDKRKSSVKRKSQAENIARIKAKSDIKSISNKEKLLILASLYWAEGAKIDFNLTNTDPDLILIFIKTLKDIFGISKDRLRLNIRIYEDMNQEDCTNFWLNLTGLSKENLSSVNILKGRKIGKLKYGMCRVRITKGGDMLKYLVAVRNRIVSLSL